MKYKPARNFIDRYVLFSDFNRGLFWGIIFAWTAVISSVLGAAVTKLVYLNKQQTIVVNNQAIWHDERVLSEDRQQVINISQEKSDLPNLESSFALLSDIYSHNLENIYLGFSFDYQYNGSLEFDPLVVFPGSIAKFTVTKATNLAFLNENSERFDAKNLPIIIQNQTNNPKLALEISSYLQEREFANIAIVNNLETKSYLSQTTIVTLPTNLKAANHLQNTLNFGILELTSSYDRDEMNNPELVINLGEDAKFFAHNQNFLYSVD